MTFRESRKLSLKVKHTLRFWRQVKILSYWVYLFSVLEIYSNVERECPWRELAGNSISIKAITGCFSERNCLKEALFCKNSGLLKPPILLLILSTGPCRMCQNKMPFWNVSMRSGCLHDFVNMTLFNGGKQDHFSHQWTPFSKNHFAFIYL